MSKLSDLHSAHIEAWAFAPYETPEYIAASNAREKALWLALLQAEDD